MKYKLIVSEKQAKTISWALDFYSRTMGGQLEDILCRFHWKNLKDDQRDEAHNTLTDLKCTLTGLNPNQPNMGLHNISEEGRIAYDLHQVIRHKIAHDNPDDRHKYSVDFDTPLKFSSESLAKIESLDE
jgi:hypothetical protein